MIVLPQLGADPWSPFPAADSALTDPNGLLAMGGDLSPARLLHAYSHGVFPWFSKGQPILWWSPDPRMVVRPAELAVSRRFRRHLRRCGWTVRLNSDFDRVVAACAGTPRPGQDGTWITFGMRRAYGDLHRLGYAHSVEVYDGDTLIGGIYGVGIGRMFFGESMFSHRSEASKTAISALCRALQHLEVTLLDGQVESDHLARLGFAPMSREQFLSHCAKGCVGLARLPLSSLDCAPLQPPRLAEACGDA